jgi:hypothetical protein
MYGQNNGYFMPMQPYYQQNGGAVPDMLNQYKGQYQQMAQPMAQPMPQQMPQAMPTQPKATNELIWVQGLEGAKGFLVAPGHTVVLWDTENPTIYVKTADATGIPSMRVLDFTERGQNTNENGAKSHSCKCADKFNNFVTKADFDGLKAQFEELQTKYDSLLEKSTKSKTTKKEIEE